MTNRYFSILIAAGLTLLALPNLVSVEDVKIPVPPIKKEETMGSTYKETPKELPSDQKRVLMMLSPLYKRIYLYALSEEQREMVAVFNKRGENPFRAIDNIMKRDRKKYDNCSPEKRPPSCGHLNTKKYFIISEETEVVVDKK